MSSTLQRKRGRAICDLIKTEAESAPVHYVDMTDLYYELFRTRGNCRLEILSPGDSQKCGHRKGGKLVPKFLS